MNDFRIVDEHPEALFFIRSDIKDVIFIASKLDCDYSKVDEYLEMGLSITHETIHQLLYILENFETCEKYDDVDINDYISGFSSSKYMKYIKKRYSLFNIKNHWLLGD